MTRWARGSEAPKLPRNVRVGLNKEGGKPGAYICGGVYIWGVHLGLYLWGNFSREFVWWVYWQFISPIDRTPWFLRRDWNPNAVTCVWHDWFISVTWHDWFVWRDGTPATLTWLDHGCDMTHSMRVLTCEAWLIHMKRFNVCYCNIWKD